MKREPRTPAEALRWAAWRHYSMAGDHFANLLNAEASRLEALEPQALSDEDHEALGASAHNATASVRVSDGDPDYLRQVGAELVDELPDGFAIVRVRP